MMKDSVAGKDSTTDVSAVSSQLRGGWIATTVAILFGLLYAYDLWEGVSPLFELPTYYEFVGLKPSDVPWPLLVVGVLIPPVVYALAFVVGLRRNVLEKVLIFLGGLALVASLSLTIIFLEQFLRPSLQVVGL
ncbi:MAG: hypothetical protein ACOH1J_06055 [Microbacteriaceae bacterium]